MNQNQAESRIKQSKDWRQRLDVILQEMKTQQSEERKEPPHEGGRHVAIAITELENVIMRNGMRMKEINATNPGTAPNPYPTSYDPSTAKVEPTADGLKL